MTDGRASLLQDACDAIGLEKVKARRLLRWRAELPQVDRDALDRSVTGELDPRLPVEVEWDEVEEEGLVW